MPIETIPETVQLHEDYLIKYWASELQVTPDHIRQAILRVGTKTKDIRKYISNGYRICIRDEDGILRKTIRIMFLNDGISVSVPYHKEKNGLLIQIPLDYSKRLARVPIAETKQFTVSDTVKLSIHMTGFVQFSTGGCNKIISGWDKNLNQPKGIGLRSDYSIFVDSGPLFTILLQGMSGFKDSKEEPCEVFEQSDFWHHPEYSQLKDTSYNIEVFMLPASALQHAQLTRGMRTLNAELPFMSKLRFLHTLRILEVPEQDFCLGVILSRLPADDKIKSGYKLFSSGFMDENQQWWNIAALYPAYSNFNNGTAKSLDYCKSASEETEQVNE